jgi:hypothetical protein
MEHVNEDGKCNICAWQFNHLYAANKFSRVLAIDISHSFTEQYTKLYQFTEGYLQTMLMILQYSCDVLSKQYSRYLLCGKGRHLSAAVSTINFSLMPRWKQDANLWKSRLIILLEYGALRVIFRTQIDYTIRLLRKSHEDPHQML